MVMAVHPATSRAPLRMGVADASRLARSAGDTEGGREMSTKKKFPIALTDNDEQRVRLAAALEGCGFGRMIVLLVREGLKRRGVKVAREAPHEKHEA